MPIKIVSQIDLSARPRSPTMRRRTSADRVPSASQRGHLHGLGDPATGRAVLAAHHAGVREAVAYLDGHLGTRRGHGGVQHVSGRGLLAVGFDHRTSREGDPLLHPHLVVANRTQGQLWTAGTCTGIDWPPTPSTGPPTNASCPGRSGSTGGRRTPTATGSSKACPRTCCGRSPSDRVLIGCRTFNEIADGAPGLSRGLLSKRLRDLERAGVVQIRPKPDGPGSTCEPTQAGRELSEVRLALQRWGSQWAELTPEHAHPGVVLWGWVSCQLDRSRLPRRRVLVRFEYPTLSGPGSRGWLLIERGHAAICEQHPGGDEDLVVVVSDPVAFARWDLGELEWGDAVRGGAIQVRGSRALARALPSWKRRVDPVWRPPAVRQATTPA
jgi:DNA-binding HxlR family transcriptional regulator